jgi:acylpyruvate hydrolase
VQGKAKKGGLPWDLAKGQDNYCPVSEFVPKALVTDPYNLLLHLKINGKTVQKDNTGGMHYKIDDLVEYISQFVTLNEGDLILTGTPEGVGPVRMGDEVDGRLVAGEKELASLVFKVL